jgi:hypothetical protein
MAEGPEHYVFNTRYGDKMPLRIVKASDICQVPSLANGAGYHAIRDLLPELAFLTDPSLYPETAHLREGRVLPDSVSGSSTRRLLRSCKRRNSPL